MLNAAASLAERNMSCIIKPTSIAKKSDHIRPIFQSLHELQVTHRIQYTISTICFDSLSGKFPKYLSGLTQPYTPTRKLRSESDTSTFVSPRVNTNCSGKDHFSYTGPSVWNNLFQSVRHSDFSSLFKTARKTHLFKNCV